MAEHFPFAPANLLRVVAQIMRAKEPVSRTFAGSVNGIAILVRCDFPGILRVFDSRDGELLTTSVQGQPETPAALQVPTANGAGDRRRVGRT